MTARYCFVCEKINIKFNKEGTVIQYVSNGEVVKEQEVCSFTNPKHGDTLELHNINITVDCEKPADAIRYSVDDLMRMIAEKH